MTQRWNPERYAASARFVADLGEPLLALLAPKAGERILDLGCGDGVLTEKIAASGATVVGVDASEAMVIAARKRGLDARVMDGQALTFDREFDAMLSNAAMHWMPKAEAVVKGVRRALKPHGRMVAEFGGKGNVDAVVGAPAVANGVVYVGCDGGNLIAFNAVTGAKLWTATTGGDIWGSPAYMNGVVIVGSADGKVYAYNAATGAPVWTSAVLGATVSSPAVANGVVYIGTDNNTVYGLNAATGATLWTATTGNVVRSSPAVTNGMVYVSSFDGNLYDYALNAGSDAAYKRDRQPPSFATLHPDRRLRPAPAE